MAKALLGSWEAARIDLHVASELDFDVETSMMLKGFGKVEPFANKIEEHRQKYERLRKERELRKIELEKLRLAQLFILLQHGPAPVITWLHYASLAAKYPKVVFLKVDTDKAKYVAIEWNVYSIPSFFLINSSREADIIIDVDMAHANLVKKMGIKQIFCI
ncbi:TPR repeat-containing thioredoxin TDX-like [Sesamum indicum]|uniref:TPR repeat-containing thioredoxin TDX-like n=1 Tax=Sesamum indicum TaxID=4182 RepID=A0A8M8UW85_SESIN|nr:TPR repeat-containing thioredoxin TDX-like [Sesamum indicum]